MGRRESSRTTLFELHSVHGGHAGLRSQTRRQGKLKDQTRQLEAHRNIGPAARLRTSLNGLAFHQATNVGKRFPEQLQNSDYEFNVIQERDQGAAGGRPGEAIRSRSTQRCQSDKE